MHKGRAAVLLGDGRLIQAVRACVFFSLKMRDYAKTYQSEGHCDGRRWTQSAASIRHVVQRPWENKPSRFPIACGNWMMTDYADSSSHQWAKFLSKWTGCYLRPVEQRQTDEIAQVEHSWTTLFQVLPSLGSMHSNTFTATTVRTSMLTWGQQRSLASFVPWFIFSIFFRRQIDKARTP